VPSPDTSHGLVVLVQEPLLSVMAASSWPPERRWLGTVMEVTSPSIDDLVVDGSDCELADDQGCQIVTEPAPSPHCRCYRLG